MKRTKIFSMMVAVLIAAMSVGFTSCSKDNEEPEKDLTAAPIMGSWQTLGHDNSSIVAEFTFNIDGTYSYNIYGEYSYNEDVTYFYVPENERSFNGLYRITEKQKTTYVLFGDEDEKNATLYKMLVSESNVFDQLWVYHTSSVTGFGNLTIHLYSNNELVQILRNFGKLRDYFGYLS